MNNPDKSIYAILEVTKRERVVDGVRLPILVDCAVDKKLLVLLWSQLGDFDTFEYAWWLQKASSLLREKNIQVRAVGIGNRQSGLKFCEYTGFPPEALFIDPQAELHHKLNLYPGLTWKFPFLSPTQQAWINLMVMCAGIASPGTLKEVLRGYIGDRQAPQLIDHQETIKAFPLPSLKGSFFPGGKGFQRPLELATLRLRNMGEVLSNWKTYVPDASYLTQRGGTFYFNTDRNLLYQHRDRGVLGFAENMSNPLGFIYAY